MPQFTIIQENTKTRSTKTRGPFRNAAHLEPMFLHLTAKAKKGAKVISETWEEIIYEKKGETFRLYFAGTDTKEAKTAIAREQYEKAKRLIKEEAAKNPRTIKRTKVTTFSEEFGSFYATATFYPNNRYTIISYSPNDEEPYEVRQLITGQEARQEYERTEHPDLKDIKKYPETSPQGALAIYGRFKTAEAAVKSLLKGEWSGGRRADEFYV